MTIRLIPDPTFDAEVKIAIAGADQPAVARFTFRALERKRVLSLLIVCTVLRRNFLVRVWEYLKLCWRTRTLATVIEMLDEMIAGWSGFDLPYSRDALRRLLLEYPDAREGIFFAYFTGLQEARIKN